jgi:hypothetical protein
MFDKIRTKLHPKTDLDCIIEDLEVFLCRADPLSEDFKTVQKNYKELVDLRKENKRKPIDPNVLLGILANLAGIIMVLKAERFSAFSTKVWGLLRRP